MSTATQPAWRIHRRLYDWVLSWAERPGGAHALFWLALAESSFFPIPPDALLIALVMGSVRRWLRFSLICTLGSALGGVIGYAIGRFFMDTIGLRIIDFYHAHHYYEQVRTWYDRYDFWIVFTAAFTPIPYKVFTIASGAFYMNLAAFTAVSVVGRGARFFLVGGLIRLAGPRIRPWIDRYFDWLALAFVLLLIGGFVLLRWAR